MISTEEENDVIEMFDDWCNHYTVVSSQLTDKDEEIKKITTQMENLTKTNIRLQTVCNTLTETISQCQRQLQVLCDLEDEIRRLKSLVAEKDQALQTEVSQHETAMNELRKSHKHELEKSMVDKKAEYDRKLAEIEKRVQEETDEKLSLQMQLQAANKDKEKKVSLITMEYEGKLTKLQRQNAQYAQQQQQVLNQDVMRKKMQHMKENYEQEIAALKSQIQEIERRHETALQQQQESGCIPEQQQPPPPNNQRQINQRRISKQNAVGGRKLKL